jgi:hypothetical protein
MDRDAVFFYERNHHSGKIPAQFSVFAVFKQVKEDAHGVIVDHRAPAPVEKKGPVPAAAAHGITARHDRAGTFFTEGRVVILNAHGTAGTEIPLRL